MRIGLDKVKLSKARPYLQCALDVCAQTSDALLLRVRCVDLFYGPDITRELVNATLA